MRICLLASCDLTSTVRYGYKVSRAGELVIDPAEADTVFFIFQHFMNGYSLRKISDALAHMGIVSPSGRAINYIGLSLNDIAYMLLVCQQLRNCLTTPCGSAGRGDDVHVS